MTSAEVFDSPAVGLLCGLEARGVTVRLDGDVLVVSPAAALTPADLAALRAYKPDCLALVRVCDPGVQARRLAFLDRLNHPGSGPLVFVPETVCRAGVCFSCGDRTADDGRPVRCWRCALAVRLALGMAIPAGGVA